MTDLEQLLDRLAAFEPVAGALATLTALTRGQVDVLFISASADAVVDDTGGDPQGPATPDATAGAVTPIAEQLVRLARTTGAHVTFIEDPALLSDVGGVGALLRYRIQPVAPATDETVQGTR
jgi:peptide subunit release factor 1 (eRF1)